jgi:hypothetical protein
MIALAISLATVLVTLATTAYHEDTKVHEDHEAIVYRAVLRGLRGSSWLRDEASPMQTAVSPRTIDKGDQTNVDDGKQAIARTDAEWTRLWQQHAPDRKRPAVDFSRDMVVGVFMGSRNTAGFAVEIAGASEANGALVVRYHEMVPPKGAVTAQVITSPYHLVSVPKFVGNVQFEKAP